MEICKEVCEIGKGSDVYVYKNTILSLNKILNFQKSGIATVDDNEDVNDCEVILQSPTALPPSRKRVQDTKSSLVNNSKLGKF